MDSLKVHFLWLDGSAAAKGKKIMYVLIKSGQHKSSGKKKLSGVWEFFRAHNYFFKIVVACGSKEKKSNTDSMSTQGWTCNQCYFFYCMCTGIGHACTFSENRRKGKINVHAIYMFFPPNYIKYTTLWSVQPVIHFVIRHIIFVINVSIYGFL